MLDDKKINLSDATRMFYVYIIMNNKFPDEIETFIQSLDGDLLNLYKNFLKNNEEF